jgi:hypothetical protein
MRQGGKGLKGKGLRDKTNQMYEMERGDLEVTLTKNRRMRGLGGNF